MFACFSLPHSVPVLRDRLGIPNTASTQSNQGTASGMGGEATQTSWLVKWYHSGISSRWRGGFGEMAKVLDTLPARGQPPHREPALLLLL